MQGNPEAEAAFHRGLARLTDIFLDCLVENVCDRLRAGNRDGALRSARLLAQESPARWESLRSDGTRDASFVHEVERSANPATSHDPTPGLAAGNSGWDDLLAPCLAKSRARRPPA